MKIGRVMAGGSGRKNARMCRPGYRRPDQRALGVADVLAVRRILPLALAPGQPDDAGSLEEREDDHQSDDGEDDVGEVVEGAHQRRPFFGLVRVFAAFTVPCHARVIASPTVSRSAVASCTMVQPLRPQAPVAGTNAPGCAAVNSRCCSGDSLTMPHFASGAMVAKT